jgi:hypothetical protein
MKSPPVQTGGLAYFSGGYFVLFSSFKYDHG